MQNNIHDPRPRRSPSVLPCTVYNPKSTRPPARPKTDKRLCGIVILLLLLFALSILIASCVNGVNNNGREALPVFSAFNHQSTRVQNEGNETLTICIDPGHGYDDPGALCDHTTRYEKDINLEISLLLAKRLKERGYKIIMTRDSDTPDETLEPNGDGLYLMNPNKRTAFVRSSGADVFISIHCNALENASDVTGTLLYYYGPSDPLTLKYANTLRAALSAAFPERKVETVGTDLENSLAVTRDVDIPSVLAEVGYMTTMSDCALLCDPEWCESFADALCEGIVDFVTNAK